MHCSSVFKRVVCGVSGGVDSAVAAAILKQKGFEVIGAFMKNWDPHDEEGTCQVTQETEYNDAKSVCDYLRIPFVEVSFVKEYWNEVFTRLLEDYEQGFTPNPDVLCNKYIKFGSFYHYAVNDLKADAIATGHYAKNSFGTFLENYDPNKKAMLMNAVDTRKNQTLFLSDIHQDALRRTMFPLGDLFKSSVRKLASDLGMQKLSKKKDSVGICFIGDRRFSHFISSYIKDTPGVFLDIDTGKVLGKHKGVHQFTIGQRCKVTGYPHAYYVVQRDPMTQTIFAALGKDHPSLYSSTVTVAKPHWIAYQPVCSEGKPFYCMFKFQHTEWTIPCRLSMVEDTGLGKVELAIPTRAITPGQQAVFYRGDVCLGSAKILAADSLVYLLQHPTVFHANEMQRRQGMKGSVNYN